MKTILEYLNPNAKIKKSEFPLTPKVDDIRKFLISQDFIEYEPKDTTLDEFYNKLKNKRFMVMDVSDHSFCSIYFCNEGTVSENNLCFDLHATYDGHIYKGVSWICKICTYTKNLQYMYNYDEFLNIVNKHFDWNIK